MGAARLFRDPKTGDWWEYRYGRVVASGERRECVGCGRAFVVPRGATQATCAPGCRELHALRDVLPRHHARRPPLEPDTGRCMNCNRRIKPSHFPFWCDQVCETEWRARVALWNWREAKRLEGSKE